MRLNDKKIAEHVFTIQAGQSSIDTDNGPWWLDDDHSREAMSDLVDDFYTLMLTWHLTDDDLQSGITAVIEYARTMVPTPNAAAYLVAVARQEARRESVRSGLPGITVPPRTRNRARSILARHGNNVADAYQSLTDSPDAAMSASSFLMAYHALAPKIDTDQPAEDSSLTDVLNHHLIHTTLLPTLTLQQLSVIILAYGFTDSVPAGLEYRASLHGISLGDPATDDSIAIVMQLSRRQVTHTRHGALADLRAILNDQELLP